MQYRASSEKVEIIGQTVYTFVIGSNDYYDSILDILDRNGISNLDRGMWYKQQDWLDAFKETVAIIGAEKLIPIGRAIIDCAIWPDGITNIPEALSSIDVAYHMNHRGGEIGHYNFLKTGISTGIMICDNPYPDEFDLGLIEGVILKFGGKPSVAIDSTQLTRNTGSNTTTYKIKWE